MTMQETLAPVAPPLRVDADGVVRVGGTRVTLDTIIGAYMAGATAEQIVEDFESLALADVHAVLSYYLRHPETVQAYLAQRRQEAEEIRRENERRFPSQGLRERLLARRAGGAAV